MNEKRAANTRQVTSRSGRAVRTGGLTASGRGR
jgi:hypothetical protein